MPLQLIPSLVSDNGPLQNAHPLSHSGPSPYGFLLRPLSPMYPVSSVIHLPLLSFIISLLGFELLQRKIVQPETVEADSLE